VPTPLFGGLGKMFQQISNSSTMALNNTYLGSPYNTSEMNP
jgi:hypothetical protein